VDERCEEQAMSCGHDLALGTCPKCDRYYVVRINPNPGCGPYLVTYDGEDWTATTKQRDAYRWHPKNRDLAELCAIDVGGRAVLVRPRTTQARSRGGATDK
jgi:hypothetical protein